MFVCYDYNKPTGCARSPTTKGCKNAAGIEFAHVCNFGKGNGDFCLLSHERHKNH